MLWGTENDSESAIWFGLRQHTHKLSDMSAHILSVSLSSGDVTKIQAPTGCHLVWKCKYYHIATLGMITQRLLSLFFRPPSLLIISSVTITVAFSWKFVRNYKDTCMLVRVGGDRALGVAWVWGSSWTSVSGVSPYTTGREWTWITR